LPQETKGNKFWEWGWDRNDGQGKEREQQMKTLFFAKLFDMEYGTSLSHKERFRKLSQLL